MLKLKNVTLGTDPELFIKDFYTDKIISSIGIIPGEKGKAYTEGLEKGFGLQIDNILAEFNVPPVKLENKEGFVNNIIAMIYYIDGYVKKINPTYGVWIASSEIIDKDQLESPEAQLFGCCPDFNAYTGDRNIAPEGHLTDLRTTGFHIHIGYDSPNTKTSIELVKYLDMYLGVPSVVVDTDFRRRDLYGKAGCFRFTTYGVEYRVLSGYFIKSKELIEWVYDRVGKALEAYEKEIPLAPEDKVSEIINTGDAFQAEELMKAFNI